MYGSIITNRKEEIPFSQSSSAAGSKSAISNLRFPFKLTKDQVEAVDAWVSNGYRGSIIYSTGTGKTEIAFECARRRVIEEEKRACRYNADVNNIDDSSSCHDDYSSFNILFLVPRIILIEQNVRRLVEYSIPRENIGVYFGEEKELREITISTYQSAVNNLELIRNSDMVIFDEMHLLTDSAITLRGIFDLLISDQEQQANTVNKKALLGLTATIDDQNPNFNTIVSLLPPVKKYLIREAVADGRLAKPVVIPIKVKLTFEEKKLYDDYSRKISNISDELNVSDPQSMSSLLRKGGLSARLARTWFANVRNRKNLINCAQNKLLAAADLIATKHPSERIMVFSETIGSIKKLKNILEQEKGIKSIIIESKLKSKDRQEVLSRWGTDFYPLLSVHTLEIGYDVPQVRIAIIMASTSNINQAAQRIGRILRKAEGKNSAWIYMIYLSDTHDYNYLGIVKQAAQMDYKRKEEKNNNNKIISARTNSKLDAFMS